MAGLAFPSGIAPGFDPSHPASARIQMSAVALGGNFIQLAPSPIGGGKPGTIAGTPASLIDGIIGPATKFAGVSDLVSWAGQPSTTFTQYTAAAICVFNSGLNNSQNQLLVASSTGTTGMLFGISIANTNNLAIFHNNTAISSTIGLTAGVPYFLACSGVSASVVNFVVVNLSNGKTTAIAIATALATGADDGTMCIGGRGTTGRQALASISAAMFSGQVLSLAQLTLWAADPWSFWYPQK